MQQPWFESANPRYQKLGGKELKTKQLVLNAIIGALYVVITLLIAPLGFGAIQVRISEMLNHLAVFNKKFAIGISIGVVIANLIASPFAVDWLLGTSHTIVSFAVFFLLTKNIESIKKKMIINTLVFSVFTFIIAIMILLSGADEAFLFLYLTLFISQFITMLVGIPVVLFLDSKLDFNKQMEK